VQVRSSAAPRRPGRQGVAAPSSGSPALPCSIGRATVGAKIRNARSFLRPLAREGLAEVRLHDTTLYNSVYRVDDQVLVNAHVYGNTAACAPVLHLRKVSGGSLVTVYLECIERVWEQAKPWNGEDDA